MKQRLLKLLSLRRALFMLTLMALTSTTAWADTETLGGYEFTIGTDKEGSYYKVDTKGALAAIAAYVNVGNNASGMRFKQTKDITLSKTWTPIGRKEYNFRGTYDGGGFNIHGLSADKDEYNGLFGYVGAMGIVKNVNVVNCSISGIENVGGIVGRNNGTIDNCTVSGTISVKESEGINSLGGICGYSSGTIKNCISTATLNNTTSASYKYFGGITGYNNGKILDCYAVGSINITASGSTCIGVVAGYNSSKGTISGTYYYAGNSGYEAVGKNNNTTEGSIEITPIQATDIDGLTYVVTGINVAGKTPCLSGYFAIADEQDLIDFANYVNASSANTCKGLTFKMTADLDFSNMPNISKFDDGNFFPIGYNYGSDCYFNGHFDGQGHTITGLRFNNYNNHIGLFFSVGSANAMVENVHLVSPTFSGRNIVGGIVAYLYAGTVRNCSVVGGSIRGYEYVGGIVGLSDYDTKSNCVKTVSGCKVIATTLLSDNGKLGIIVGGNTNDADATKSLTISNCTYHNPADLDICGAGDGDRYTDGGGNKRVYQAALGTGVTASNPVYCYGSNYYFESGAIVTLGHNRPGYVFGGYASSDVAITNGTFTMPANDVTVTANFEVNLHDFTVGDLTYHNTSATEATITGCSRNATSVTIPATVTDNTVTYAVTAIGDNAFYDCNNLASITIPASVTSICDDAFRGCNNLTSIGVDDNNDNYTSDNDVLFNKDKTTLIQYPAGNSRTVYTIPTSVTSIGKDAFYSCSNLSMIYCLASTAPALGSDEAFDECDDWLAIIVPADAYDSYNTDWSDYDSYLEKGYTLSCGTDVTATSANNGPLVQEGEKVTLSYTGTVPEGSVFGGFFYGSYLTRTNTFLMPEMPAQDVTVTAAISSLSGTCGTTDHETDVTWALTDEDKDGTYDMLTISGTGAMADYDTNNQPWAVLKSDINTIIVGEGITDIGSNAFTGCTNLERAYILPTTVPATSSNVFDECGALSAIVVPGVARDRYWSEWYGKNNYPYAPHIIEGYTVTCASGITVTTQYNGPLVKKDEVVTITNTVPSVAPEGYEAPFLGYKVMDTNNLIQSVTEEAGVYTFPMPDCYATVVPAWTTIPWEGSGSTTDPYIIEYASQLDLLAERVNSGTDPTDTKKYEDYTDTYFELGRDIEYAHTTNWDDAASTEKNFTSIGCYKHTTGIYYAERSFNGHFDGKGHRISGIRIFSRSNSYCIAGYEGIFGNIGPSATVSGIILDDTRITGHCYIGGIAGHNDGIISDCHVTDKVNIHVITDGSTIFGGIAGSNNDGTISGCTSAVSITSTTANSPNPYKIGTRIGGIAGANYSTLKDCLFLGTTLEGEEMLGAIVGSNGEGSSVENCYYTSTAIQSTLGGSGNSSTVTNCGLAPSEDLDNNAFVAAMAARTAALTAVERKPALNTDVALTYKRSFTADKASTVCLPFDYTPDDTDGRFYTFVGITKENDQYIATMKENAVKELTANTPYLFMPANTGEVDFSGDYTIKESKDAPATITTDWTFKGTYSYIKWTSDENDADYTKERADEIGKVYGFAGGATDNVKVGDFVRVASGAKIRPMSCYLQWNDEPAKTRSTRGETEQLPSRITVRLVGSHGESTGIGELNTETGEFTTDGWFSLDGRKLSAKPTQRGIYINNGKKVIIK